MRPFTIAFVVIMSAAAVGAADDGAAGMPGQRMSVQPNVATRAQVLAETDRLRTGLPPRPGGPIDAVGRGRAEDAYRWMAVAGGRYRTDPVVMAALMRTYGVMGDYYNGYYPAGAWLGYAGASQWARRNWLFSGQTTELQRDLARYALGWATVGYAQGSWFWRPPELAQSDLLQGDAPGARETLERVALPEIDESTLNAEQRSAWRDLRAQFTLVSSRVHEARVLLDGLAQRLSARGMSLNGQDGATALSMQGFLVDAVDFIKERDFGHAREALTRAEYERVKLKGTTGQ